MRLLISHPKHPAQFRRLAPYLVSQGHDVVFLTGSHEWHANQNPTYRLKRVDQSREGGGAALHPYLRRMDTAVLQGQATYRAAMKLRQEGWIPDVVISHVGFGNGLYLSDAFPHSRRIGLVEWFYNAVGSDLEFLHDCSPPEDLRLRQRAWNAPALIEMADLDVAVAPTQWQRAQFPAWMQKRIQVIHEGIDVKALGELKLQPCHTRFGVPEDPACEILTYVSRGFEEYRGFPQAMQAIASVQRSRPNLHCLLVGSDAVAYGSARADGLSWKAWAVQNLGLDPSRTHWLGVLQESEYHQVLALSDVHLYLTVPFVLSWSLLESMAAGCAIVSSDTAPVREVLRGGEEALLADFHDSELQASLIEQLLDDPSRRLHLSNAARLKAQAYSSELGCRAWERLLCEDTD